jgi:hypothetical protein
MSREKKEGRREAKGEAWPLWFYCVAVSALRGVVAVSKRRLTDFVRFVYRLKSSVACNGVSVFAGTGTACSLILKSRQKQTHSKLVDFGLRKGFTFQWKDVIAWHI